VRPVGRGVVLVESRTLHLQALEIDAAGAENKIAGLVGAPGGYAGWAGIIFGGVF